MKTSPRVAQYTKNWSDAEIDAVISRKAVKVELNGRDFATQAEVLANAIRGIFLPDAQIRDLLRYLISLACGHAQVHLDSDDKYLNGLYSPLPWESATSAAVCLTGLAGVGKSELLIALGKLLSAKDTFSVLGHINLPLEPVWSMTLALGSGLNQILKGFVLPGGNPTKLIDGVISGSIPTETKDLKIPLLLNLAKRMSWRGAVCLLTIDEFQRIAVSDSANAKATSILVQLLSIGPLLVYCPNYSLVHKLQRRKQEDRQRLLSRPVVLHPPSSGSESWIAYLLAVKSVAPDVFIFGLQKDAEDMHRYTSGLRRLVVELVLIAFRIAKLRSSAGVLDGSALLAAYCSADYSMNREDVEVLHTQAITGKMIREDLWCPFISTEAASKVKPLDAAVTSFERRTEEAFLESALLPSESATVKALSSAQPKSKGPAKVFRFRRGKATKDDLLAGAVALDLIE